VHFYDLVFEMIDMRSFSNLWYWIVLAVMWSSLSHFILGVPFDMVTRARRRGGPAMADLEDMVRIQVNRRLYIARVSGMWLVGFGAGVLTVLATLGFWYRLQFAQALFLLLLPASLVGAMSVMLAARIDARRPRGEDLCRALARHRLMIQFIGILAIFITAIWGMYQNLNVGPLLSR